MLDSKTATQSGRPITHSTEAVWSTAAAILLAAFFLATSLYIAGRRLFWMDEIFTVVFARLPNVADIWKALHTGADTQPLPFYLLVRASEAIFGRGELAARVPSAIALTVGLLFTFACVRRFAGGAYAVLALLVLACSFVPYYGHEARPYGLLFMFSAILLWVWLSGEGRERRTAWIFGVVACASAMIHIYTAFTLVPFGAYEFLRGRWFSRRLIAGAIGTALGVAMSAPELAIGRQLTSLPTWASQPSPEFLRYIFESMTPKGVFLMAVVAILAALASLRKSPPPAPMPAEERLCWLFLLIPMVGFVVAELVTRSFYDRYFIAMMPGMAAGAAGLLYRHFAADRWVTAALLVFFAAIGISRQVEHTLHPEEINAGTTGAALKMIAAEDTFNREGKIFTAIANEQAWSEAWYYSKHPERYISLHGTDSISWRLKSVVPSVLCWSTEDLRQHTRDAVVMSDLGKLQELKDAGFHETIRQASPLLIYYLQ